MHALSCDVEIYTSIGDDVGHDYHFTSRHTRVLDDVFQARDRLLSLLRLTNSVIVNFANKNAILVPLKFSHVWIRGQSSPVILNLDTPDIRREEYFDPLCEAELHDDYRNSNIISWALGVGLRNPNARMILRYLSNAPNWDDLYRICEIISRQQSQRFVEDAFPDFGDFKRTANDDSAGGETARHVQPIGMPAQHKTLRKPPRRPMALEDASDRVRKLVVEWFKKLDSENVLP